MRPYLILTLSCFVFLGCKKSRFCIKKTDLKIEEVNEQDITYTNHSSIGIPQYFTPNSDNTNDYFELTINDTLASQKEIRTSEENGFKDLSLSISNKCDLLFQSFDPYTRWDGKFDGELGKKGQYEYKIKVTWNDDSFEEIEGTFDLVN